MGCCASGSDAAISVAVTLSEDAATPTEPRKKTIKGTALKPALGEHGERKSALSVVVTPQVVDSDFRLSGLTHQISALLATPHPDQTISSSNNGGDFGVSLFRKAEEKLGLGLDVGEGKYCCVTRVFDDGAVNKHNQATKHDNKISLGDYITSVNGVTDGHAMLHRLQEDSSLHMTVTKCIYLSVCVERGERSLGVRLALDEHKDYMVIKSIFDGAISSYNADVQSDKQIRVFSRILSVNGFKGTSLAMFRKLDASTLLLEISQPCQLTIEDAHYRALSPSPSV